MKRLLLAAALLANALPAPLPAHAAPDTSPLALPERRALQTYQASTFPALQARIREAAGFEVPLDVQWEALAMRGQAASFNEPDFWTNVIFVPLEDALRATASDETGKKALRDGLKSILVTYDPATAPASAYERGVTFEDGVLQINFQPFTNVNDRKDRADAIRKVLEAGL